MTQAQSLADALNALAKNPQFDASRARATAREAGTVDAAASRERNADFNADVDGCPDFVMLDGSVCAWNANRRRYAAAPPTASGPRSRA